MRRRINSFALFRRLLATISLLAMTAVFFIPAAARWCGFLPRLQLVPAICAGAVLELVALAILAALFGRLYCSILCPLGILQDLFRFCFGWLRPHKVKTTSSSCAAEPRACATAEDAAEPRACATAEDAAEPRACATAEDAAEPRACAAAEDAAEPRACAAAEDAAEPRACATAEDAAETKSERSPSKDKPTIFRLLRVFPLRYAILSLFLLAIPLGFTGLLEPYGIFGRFLASGIRRAGEPAVVTVVWAIGLVVLILFLAFVRPRFWCNRICPVGTFLGLFSRFALFRVRIDADACVKCGACVKRCDKGALKVRADRSIAIDHSCCIACGDCLTACPKGALKTRPPRRAS